MQGQLAAAERKCAQAETVCGELKASAQDTETTVREVREFASALGQENEELERQYVQARRDLQAALDDKELLTSRELEESMARENLETSLRDLEEEVEAKQTQIGKASRQAEDLAERHAAATKQLAHDHETNMQKQSLAVRRLEDRCNDLDSINSRRLADFDAFRSDADSKLQRAAQDHHALGMELAEARKQKQILMSELERHTNEFQRENELLFKKQADLERTNADEIARTNEKYERQLQAADEKYAEAVNRRDDQLKEAQDANAAAAREHHRQLQEVQDKCDEDLRRVKREWTRQAELAREENERSVATAENAARNKCEAASAELASLQVELSDTRSELAAERRAIASKAADLEMEQHATRALAQKSEAAAAEVDLLTEELRVANQAGSESLEALRREMRDETERAEHAESEHSRLERQLRTQREDWQSQIEDKEKEAARAQKNAQERQAATQQRARRKWQTAKGIRPVVGAGCTCSHIGAGRRQ